MTQGKWDGSDLSGLSYDYLHAVLMRMEQHGRDSAIVRFGLLGEGVKPNYQIEGAEGLSAYSSSNHQLDQKSEEYEPKNLSKLYTFDEVNSLVSSRLKSMGDATKETISDIYTMPSDQAYEKVLNVLPAGQRWFSFDVLMDPARKGQANRFGMALWNFHALPGTRAFEAWAISQDPASGTYWYRVGKGSDGETSRNRKSLLDALQIAIDMPNPIPMRGILKDGRTHMCAPDYVFNITEVMQESDGSALWLKLEVPDDNIGTSCNEQILPAMTAMHDLGSNAAKRSGAMPEEQYLAVRDAAVRVVFQHTARQEEIKKLNLTLGINESTAGALINNFRCLVNGKEFKVPMRALGLQLFIDAIVAKHGIDIVPNVISAAEGYINYAEKMWGGQYTEMRQILNALKSESQQETLLQDMAKAAESALPPSSPKSDSVPSEILREVWVRGPQHAAFRRELQRRWNGKCSVHGTPCNGQLRASHVVAWSLDEELRGDVNNGLFLSVPLDNLFDRGLISFDDSGALILSKKLGLDTMEHFGVRNGLHLAWDHLTDQEKQALRVNLARHREQHEVAS